ncbi:MAG TPA: DUF397 domain-containing protein [Pseudonocardiaceae bacterium]
MTNSDLTDPRWIKSSFSEPSGNCLELTTTDGHISIRDSKLTDTSPILTITPAQMKAFLHATKGDYFNHLP